jgi:predicted dehydrogenase
MNKHAKGKYRAAIVGLGQVGLLFDLDSKRKGVWTHFSAYETLNDKYDLVAVCDINTHNCILASERKPSLRVYSDIAGMMSSEKLDVVSICTPPEYHSGQISFLSNKTKAIICEKPLDSNLDGCQNSLNLCNQHKTIVAVNYYKRFEGCIPQVKKILDDRVIGDITTATTYYSGPLDAVGSHAINLLQFLFGSIDFVYGVRCNGEIYNITFKTKENAIVNLVSTGGRESLVFETDIIGVKGRIRVLDNNDSFELYKFEESKRYSGYEELNTIDIKMDIHNERFLPMFEDVYKDLEGGGSNGYLSGINALDTQIMLDVIKAQSTIC